MEQQTAQAVVLCGGSLAVLVWLCGVRSTMRLAADSGKLRTRVPVKSADAAALAVLVHWGTQEGRQVTEQAEDRVVVAHGRARLHLVLARDTAGPTLEVSADLSVWRRRLLQASGIIVFGVAPAVLVGLGAGLYYLAAASPNSGVRWQTVQIVQCVHVLWPPFLLSSVYFRLRRQAVEIIPANLRALIAVAGH